MRLKHCKAERSEGDDVRCVSHKALDIIHVYVNSNFTGVNALSAEHDESTVNLSLKILK